MKRARVNNLNQWNW